MNHKIRQEITSRCLAVFTAIFVFVPSVSANPTGAQVVNGQVVINEVTSQLLEITNSNGSIINWQGFSINTGEITRFIQENASSAVLNRVIGADPSSILGQLHSNGQVFLINPNGIVFGPDSVIDVNGFVASTLNMTNQDFLQEQFRFSGDGNNGAIDARGSIKSQGNVLLIAPDIKNSGIISSQNGNIVLAAGEKVLMLDQGVDELVFEVQAPDNQAVNLGKLIAGNGAVGMFASQLKQQGVIEADRVTRDADGTIKLVGDDVSISGSLMSRGLNENVGGNIGIYGDEIQVSGATISADGAAGGGKIEIGGGYQGGGTERLANNTHIDGTTRVSANATHLGNGGEIIVWSENHTETHGLLSATGGPNGGDGGLIETSGKKTLEFSTPADVSADNGVAGTWLLDPEDIDINGSKASSIESALNHGSNVNIQTRSSGEGEGNINVNSSITKTDGGDAKLTLDAHNEVNVNAPIRSQHNELDVKLIAGQEINVNADIDSNGGKISTQVTGIAPVPEDSMVPVDTGIVSDPVLDGVSPDQAIVDAGEENTSDVSSNGSQNTEEIADVTGGSLESVTGNKSADQMVTEVAVLEISVDSLVPELDAGAGIADPGSELELLDDYLDTDISTVSTSQTNISGNLISQGGDIVIDNGETGTVTITGTVSVADLDQGNTGGNITIQGEYIALNESATLDASGDSGGGTILVGGDYKGENPDIYNATVTFVGSDASIKADAITEGDGGKVIVWADDLTQFYGDISATGGSESGDGGFVETSGKNYLEAYGTVDASAANGEAGSWLLDPRDVELRLAPTSAGSFSGGNPDTFNPDDTGGGPSVVNISTIENSLDMGTSVIITTNQTGIDVGDDGDITVVDQINKSAGGAATLTLDAADDIILNNNIFGNGNLSLTLIAGNANDADDSGVVIDTTVAGQSLFIQDLDVLDIQSSNGGGVLMNADGSDIAFLSAQQVSVNVDGGVKVINNSMAGGDTRLESLGNTDDTSPYDMEINAEYVHVQSLNAGFSEISTNGGSQSIVTSGVIPGEPGVSIYVEAHGSAEAAIHTNRFDMSGLVDTGMQTIDANGGIKLETVAGSSGGAASMRGEIQTISADYLEIVADGGFVAIHAENNPGDPFSVPEQIINLDGTKPGTNDAITLTGTGGGYAQIGLFGLPTLQTISITSPNPDDGDIRIHSDGVDSGAGIIGEQQIFGATSSESAGDVILTATNSGFSFIRGRDSDPSDSNNGGQTLVVKSIYLEGDNDGFSQISADVPSSGAGTETPEQDITVTGTVDGMPDVGIYIVSIDDGGASITSRNRSSDFDGVSGVTQNFRQVGLKQEIDVQAGGIIMVSMNGDSPGYDGDSPNSGAFLTGGNQDITAEFFELISDDGAVLISNRDDFSTPDSGSKVQNITATGIGPSGYSIFLQNNSQNFVEISSLIQNVSGEPGGTGANTGGTIGVQQTISAANGIRIENNGSPEDTSLYGVNQNITAEFIELIANGGDVGIFNEGDVSDPETQTITTTGSNEGVAILLETTGDSGASAQISSFDQVEVLDPPNPPDEEFFGLPVDINADSGIFQMLNSSDLAESGTTLVYGGPIDINAQDIEIFGGAGPNSTSSIVSDTGIITLAAVDTILLQGGTGVDADAQIRADIDDVNLTADNLILNGVVGGGSFDVSAQLFGGNGSTINITAGTITSDGNGTITDPGLIVVTSDSCTIAGNPCSGGNPVFDAPTTEFNDLTPSPPPEEDPVPPEDMPSMETPEENGMSQTPETPEEIQEASETLGGDVTNEVLVVADASGPSTELLTESTDSGGEQQNEDDSESGGGSDSSNSLNPDAADDPASQDGGVCR